MSDPQEKETIQNFLKGMNGRIIVLEELVDRCAGLLGLEPPIAKEAEDKPSRPGTFGSILDSIEGMTQKIRDIAGNVSNILDELEHL